MTLRWGILSTADIGMSKVTPAIQAADRCEVVAIGPRSAESARAAADKLGIANLLMRRVEALSGVARMPCVSGLLISCL